MDLDPPRRYLVQLVADTGTNLKYLSVEVLGRNHAYLQQYVRKNTPLVLDEDDREKLGKFFKVEPRNFKTGSAAAPARSEIISNEISSMRAANFEGPRDLPVFGRAVGGKETWFEFNGERLDTLFRPPVLTGVQDAYAMFVDGDSMVPRYKAGETIYVHPKRPVRAGDFVVALLQPEQDGGHARALIKELVLRSGDQVVLRSLNPPNSKVIKIPAAQVISLHKIVLGGEG